MRQLLHHCTRRQSDRWILNWTRWWWQHAVVLSGNGKLRRRFARSVGRSRRYRIHRNRWRFSRWRLWFGRFLFLDRFSPSYFNRRTIDLCICKIQNTLNWLTYVTRGKKLLTIHAAHCLLSFLSRRKMNKCKITHHLKLLHIVVWCSVENFTQYLFRSCQWKIAHVQNRDLNERETNNIYFNFVNTIHAIYIPVTSRPLRFHFQARPSRQLSLCPTVECGQESTFYGPWKLHDDLCIQQMQNHDF